MEVHIDNNNLAAIVKSNLSADTEITGNATIDQLTKIKGSALNNDARTGTIAYTKISDEKANIFTDLADVNTMSSFIKEGIDVVVEDAAAATLLNKIKTTIKANNNSSKTLTATVEDTFTKLTGLSVDTADILNYKVTNTDSTIDNINSLVKNNNTVTATITIDAANAGNLATKSTDKITVKANANSSSFDGSTVLLH